MDIVSYFKSKVPGYGVWLGAADSQAVVERNDFSALDKALALEPKPAAIYVKFGGDFADGLWGNPNTWKAVRDHAANVVPYLYGVPEFTGMYSKWFGLLYGLGFIFCAFDVEYEWSGQEAELDKAIASLNPEYNALAIVGLAWFNGYANYGAYANVVNKYVTSVLYMPMAYVSEITSPVSVPTDPPTEATNGVELVDAWMKLLFPVIPVSVILDAQSLTNTEAVALFEHGVGGSVWQVENIDAAAWANLSHPEPPDVAVSVMKSVLVSIGSDIGYAKTQLEAANPAQAALDDAMGKLANALQGS